MLLWHVFFSGEVQGVGFRNHAQRFASDLELTGWVRNLHDGRVEMMAEGTRPDLERLTEKLHNRFTITATEVKESAATGQFDSFSIRR